TPCTTQPSPRPTRRRRDETASREVESSTEGCSLGSFRRRLELEARVSNRQHNANRVVAGCRVALRFLTAEEAMTTPPDTPKPPAAPIQVMEGVSGTWFYHLGRKGQTTALCGARVMTTQVPLSAWGHVGHLHERWCAKCADLHVAPSPGVAQARGGVGATYR